MPELAEVVYFSQQWQGALGERVSSVSLHPGARIFRGCSVSSLQEELPGRVVRGIETHGKRILVRTSGGGWLGIHLGMTGKLFSEPSPYTPEKHAHFVFTAAGCSYVFRDPRQFGRVLWYVGVAAPSWWRDLPPEVLSARFSRRKFEEICKRRARSPIKALLLEQAFFPGIGNWMADEILWQARVVPHRLAGALSAVERGEVWKKMRSVTRGALATIGRDWRDPPSTWLFRYRWKRGGNCPRCGGALKHMALRGRTTCWCPECQGS